MRCIAELEVEEVVGNEVDIDNEWFSECYTLLRLVYGCRVEKVEQGTKREGWVIGMLEEVTQDLGWVDKSSGNKSDVTTSESNKENDCDFYEG